MYGCEVFVVLQHARSNVAADCLNHRRLFRDLEVRGRGSQMEERVLHDDAELLENKGGALGCAQVGSRQLRAVVATGHKLRAMSASVSSA